MTDKELAAYIDHTLLDPVATRGEIEQLCDEAIEYRFHSVCVLPRWTSLAAEKLRGSEVVVDGVAGFPFGADSAKIKAAQTKEVIMAGADEIDMVADLPSIIEGNSRYLRRDIQAVMKVCRSFRPAVVLKVIIEASALTEKQIRFACQECEDIGVDYIKTSTGMHKSGGASVEAVQIMAESAPGCKIKAAGGIRTADDAVAMIEAGASRIGCSASVRIIEEFRQANR
ncbi:Deoxyribose-phosphate aldolase 1 [Anaerohalosphaera lusitana]|uniref:Deoxyribose-phosphate aldolase n=1 Tax=Anaerohalosphaera lusitana TaxID=1936003 RepID=A0A1U9NJJ6_9BACT|nr:deoxyribose-phosphate aldolase [Anaerohalosphaera lusitana]AQT67750.1 Deoxyribose-phosphate aldolase 1 [Anaerohalosphaera lusitana]